MVKIAAAATAAVPAPALQNWMTECLNYQANSSKTRIEKVILAHDEWKRETIENRNAIDSLEKEYAEKHSGPRNEIEAKYELFKNDQLQLMQDWHATKNATTLAQLVSLKRETAGDGGAPDPIYTMFSLPNSV